MKNTKHLKLGYYLAGLIEGDGNIWIPATERFSKNELRAPSIAITFHKNELPFFEHIKSVIGGGYIYQSKSDNSCSYRIVKSEILIKVINLINGKFRTPKIYCLHRVIDFVNLKHNLNIKKMPLDNSNLNSNPWLSGFVDADGCFYIGLLGKYSVSKNNRKYGEVRCRFHLTQRIIDKLTGKSCIPFMTDIANIFRCRLYITSRHNTIRIVISKTDKLKLVNSYFNEHPLMTSKYLNYRSYMEGINYLNRQLSDDEIIEIQTIKGNMNTKRTHFNWDHLKNFYK